MEGCLGDLAVGRVEKLVSSPPNGSLKLSASRCWDPDASHCLGEQDKADAVNFEGASFIAGAAVQWLRHEVGIIADAAESERHTAAVLRARGLAVTTTVTTGQPNKFPCCRTMCASCMRPVWCCLRGRTCPFR